MRFTLVVLTALYSSSALAQVAVQQWRPSTSAGGFVVLESAGAPSAYGLGTSLWLQYAREPLATPAGGGENVVVSDQMTADLTASFGMFSWLALSLDIPSTVYQGSGYGILPRRFIGVGDSRLLAKMTIFRPGPKSAGWGLSLIPEFGLPLGDSLSLLSEQNFSFTPRMALAYQASSLQFLVNSAYHFRQSSSLGLLSVDDEIMFGAGVEWQISQWPLALLFELTSATAARRPFQDFRESSVEGFFSTRARIGSWTFRPGMAVGLTPGYLVPDYRFFVSWSYAPRYRDADGDGVPDATDQCLSQAEDKDDFRDRDGCPDPDNDGDGVLDRADRCPDQAGPVVQSGCPEFPRFSPNAS